MEYYTTSLFVYVNNFLYLQSKLDTHTHLYTFMRVYMHAHSSVYEQLRYNSSLEETKSGLAIVTYALSAVSSTPRDKDSDVLFPQSKYVSQVWVNESKKIEVLTQLQPIAKEYTMK